MILDYLYSKQKLFFTHIISRSFEKINLHQNTFTSIFNLLRIPVEQIVLIIISITRINDGTLHKLSRKYFENEEFQRKIIDNVTEGNFSFYVLQELLFQTQSAELMKSSTREKILSLLGKELYSNRGVQKKMRLFLFKQNVFNFKPIQGELNNLLSFSNYVKIENTFSTYTIALRFMPESMESPEGFAALLKKMNVLTERDVALVLCAYFKKVSEKYRREMMDRKNKSKKSGRVEDKNINVNFNSQTGENPISTEKKSESEKIYTEDVFVRTVHALLPSVSWQRVIMALDNNKFCVEGEETESLFVRFILNMGKDGVAYLRELMYNYQWNYQASQFRMLKITLKFPSLFASKSKRKIWEYGKGSKNGKLFPHKLTVNLSEPLTNLLSLDFIGTLASFKNSAQRICAEQLLWRFAVQSPVFVFSALSQSKINSLILQKTMQRIVIRALKPPDVRPEKSEKQVTIPDLFAADFTVTSKLLNKEFESDHFQIDELFNVLKDYLKDKKGKILQQKLEPTLRKMGRGILSIGISLAFFQKGLFKNFIPWLIKQKKDSKRYLEHSIRILFERNIIGSSQSVSKCKGCVLYSASLIDAVLKTLGQTNLEIYRNVFAKRRVAQRILRSTRLLIKSFYCGEISAEKLVEQFKSPSERESLGIFIEEILAEARFHTEYSMADVDKTAKLMGVMIKESIIPQKANRRMEKTVLNFLRTTSNAREFAFASGLIPTMLERIESYPNICTGLVGNERLKKDFPDSYSVVEKLFDNKKMTVQYLAPQGSGLASVRKMKTFGTKASRPEKIKTLESVKLELSMEAAQEKERKLRIAERMRMGKNWPGKQQEIKLSLRPVTANNPLILEQDESEMKKKIRFLLNNLSEININQTSIFVNEQMHSAYCEYFAKTFVFQKVASEGNYHEVFFAFYRKIQRNNLIAQITKFAYEKAKEYTSKEALESSADNNNLKNIANWLGGTLIANNKPLQSKHINLKEILIEAFFAKEKRDKKLLAVVVFASNILCYCNQSAVFQMPCPWFLGLLCLLKEIYNNKIELNVKFEIERLLKRLEIKMTDIEKGCNLVVRCFLRGDKTKIPVMQNVKPEAAAESQKEVSPPRRYVLSDPVTAYNHSILRESYKKSFGAKADEAADLINAAIPRDIQFSAECFPAASTEAEQIAIKKALIQTMMNVFIPLIDRCAEIANETTLELLKKDFGFEPSDIVYISGAINTARGLMGSLVIAMIHESLRAEMCTIIVSSLRMFHDNMELVKRVSKILLTDNFAACCNLIINIADLRIRRKISLSIQPSVELRKKYKASGLYFPGENLAYSEKDFKKPLYPNCLPFELQPKRSGLTAQQLKLYDMFKLLTDSHRRATEEWTKNKDFFDIEIDEAFLDNSGVSEEINMEDFPAEKSINYLINDFQAKNSVSADDDRIKQRLKEYIQSNDIRNFAIIKTFEKSDILRRYEEVRQAVRKHPTPRIRFVDLPPDDSIRGKIEIFLSYLSSECAAAKKKEHVITLLLLSDRIYNEMFAFSFSLLFSDMSAMSLKTVLREAKEIGKQLRVRLTRFYVKEGDNKKFTMEIFTRLLCNNLLDPNIVDICFANLMRSEKPQLHIRSVYFMAAYFNSAASAEQPSIRQNFPRVVKVFLEIARGQYCMDRLDESAVKYFAELEGRARNAMKEWITPEKRGDNPKISFRKTDETGNSMRAAAKLLLIEWQRCRDDTSRENFVLSERFLRQISEHGFFGAVVAVSLERYQRCAVPDLETGSIALLIYTYATKIALKPSQSLNTLLTLFRAIIDSAISGHQQSDLYPEPHFAIILRLMRLFNSKEHSDDTARSQVIVIFIECLTHLEPASVPGFIFAWMTLITEKAFIVPLLRLRAAYAGKCRLHTMQLLAKTISYIAPRLMSEEIEGPFRRLYLGFLRFFIALNKNFGYFLSEFYFELSGAAPENCMQLRNIVLASSPSSRQNKVYSYGKMDSMMGEPPSSRAQWEDYLRSCEHGAMGEGLVGLRKLLSEYLSFNGKERQTGEIKLAPNEMPNDYFRKLGTKLCIENPSAGLEIAATRHKYFSPFRYNRKAIRAAAAYIGVESLRRAREIYANAPSDSKPDISRLLGSGFIFYERLIRVLDIEAKYHLINALADHVRFHSTHTHFFSLAILAMFGKSEDVTVKEIIMRVLMERLCSYGPHPVGLTSLFVELTQNPFYNVTVESFAGCSAHTLLMYKSLVNRFSKAYLRKKNEQDSDEMRDLKIERK